MDGGLLDIHLMNLALVVVELRIEVPAITGLLDLAYLDLGTFTVDFFRG